MTQNHELTSTQVILIADPSRYRRLIGKFIYLTITRPDISYAVQTLGQFMANHGQQHLQVVHKLVKYLKGSLGQGLFFSSSSSLQLTVYCDTDWAACNDTRRS